MAVAHQRGGVVTALVERARQWLSARERLVRRWFNHLATRRHPRAAPSRLGGAGAIVLPHWWEYESELKCSLALEAVMRRLFMLVPETTVAR